MNKTQPAQNQATRGDRQRFFGYRHVNGGLHLKRYFEPYGADSLNDAKESPFVEAVFGPFTANDRKHAESILKSELGSGVHV